VLFARQMDKFSVFSISNELTIPEKTLLLLLLCWLAGWLGKREKLSQISSRKFSAAMENCKVSQSEERLQTKSFVISRRRKARKPPATRKNGKNTSLIKWKEIFYVSREKLSSRFLHCERKNFKFSFFTASSKAFNFH